MIYFGQKKMTKKQAIQLFQERKVRTVWDDQEEKWYFSIVDVCGVLTDSKDALTAREFYQMIQNRSFCYCQCHHRIISKVARSTE